MANHLSLSTDQVSAFVELARQGSVRAAAKGLHLTEQGLRNRLLALERNVGANLYVKRRGPRRGSLLTDAGRRFLPGAADFLERAGHLTGLFGGSNPAREIHVAATQYLIVYVLIDAVRRFHAAHPHIRVRLSNRTEREIEDELRHDPDLAMGVAAPYEPAAELEYRPLFSLAWGLIAPPRHPLLTKGRLTLRDLTDVPLILFERGSTGRQHVIDAFHGAGLSPRVEMETTNTEIIVRMVEAGLGLSVVPLMPGGAITRGHRVGARGLGGQIRPIHSGILTRRGEAPSAAGRAFVEFLVAAGGRVAGNSDPLARPRRGSAPPGPG